MDVPISPDMTETKGKEGTDLTEGKEWELWEVY